MSTQTQVRTVDHAPSANNNWPLQAQMHHDEEERTALAMADLEAHAGGGYAF